MSLEERLLQGQEDGISFQTDAEKSKALEILSRTELGRKQAERLWGPNVWGRGRGSISDAGRSLSNPIDEDMMRQDEGNVDQMFKEMTNQDEEDDKRNDNGDVEMTAASLEKERNGMDALLDGA
jgi:histone demethylase JARID1